MRSGRTRRLCGYLGTRSVIYPLSSSPLLRVALGNAYMSRFAPLFSQRVPLYIFLPVITACGAAGYIANTTGSGSPIIDQAQTQHGPVATSPVAEQATPDQKELSDALSPTRDASSISLLPAAEVDIPTPAPRVVERTERVPPNVIESAPPVPVTKAMPENPRATRAVRAVSKPPRPQRVARQPTSTPATASTGLKNIPLIGPVFSSLLQ